MWTKHGLIFRRSHYVVLSGPAKCLLGLGALLGRGSACPSASALAGRWTESGTELLSLGFSADDDDDHDTGAQGRASFLGNCCTLRSLARARPPKSVKRRRPEPRRHTRAQPHHTLGVGARVLASSTRHRQHHSDPTWQLLRILIPDTTINNELLKKKNC